MKQTKSGIRIFTVALASTVLTTGCAEKRVATTHLFRYGRLRLDPFPADFDQSKLAKPEIAVRNSFADPDVLRIWPTPTLYAGMFTSTEQTEVLGTAPERLIYEKVPAYILEFKNVPWAGFSHPATADSPKSTILIIINAKTGQTEFMITGD